MTNSRQTKLVSALAGFLLLFLLGAAQKDRSTDPVALEARVDALEKQLAAVRAQAFVPELGDLMGTMQRRHARLWFAGENENWALAAYELHEMHEGFEAVEKFHPTHGKVPVSVKQLLGTCVEPPLNQLAKTVEAKDKQNFPAVFDRVTAGCNACHLAAGVAFNVVKRPTVPPFSNQDFALRR